MSGAAPKGVGGAAAGAGMSAGKQAMAMAGPAGAAASGLLSVAEGAMAIHGANEQSKAAGGIRVAEQQAARQQGHQAVSTALGAEGVVASARGQAVSDAYQQRDIALIEAKEKENQTKADAKTQTIMGGLQIAGGALQTAGGVAEGIEKFNAPKASLKDSVDATKGPSIKDLSGKASKEFSEKAKYKVNVKSIINESGQRSFRLGLT